MGVDARVRASGRIAIARSFITVTESFATLPEDGEQLATRAQGVIRWRTG